LIDKNQYQRDYYKDHKEIYKKTSTNWRNNNKTRWSEITSDNIKKKSDKLKAEGQKFTFLSKTEREKRMIDYISRVLKISKKESRELLKQYNWNCILLEKEKRNDI